MTYQFARIPLHRPRLTWRDWLAFVVWRWKR